MVRKKETISAISSIPEIPIAEFGNKVDSEKKEGGLDRRGKILVKIQQDGICFLKDIAVLFPEYSERTLRYDLEKLCEEGAIEKIGNSGPGTFYRSFKERSVVI